MQHGGEVISLSLFPALRSGHLPAFFSGLRFQPRILLQLLLVSGQCFLYTAYTHCYRILTRRRSENLFQILLLRNFIMLAKLPFAAITNQIL
jgi:hypothetical protein